MMVAFIRKAVKYLSKPLAVIFCIIIISLAVVVKIGEDTNPSSLVNDLMQPGESFVTWRIIDSDCRAVSDDALDSRRKDECIMIPMDSRAEADATSRYTIVEIDGQGYIQKTNALANIPASYDPAVREKLERGAKAGMVFYTVQNPSDDGAWRKDNYRFIAFTPDGNGYRMSMADDPVDWVNGKFSGPMHIIYNVFLRIYRDRTVYQQKIRSVPRGLEVISLADAMKIMREIGRGRGRQITPHTYWDVRDPQSTMTREATAYDRHLAEAEEKRQAMNRAPSESHAEIRQSVPSDYARAKRLRAEELAEGQ